MKKIILKTIILGSSLLSVQAFGVTNYQCVNIVEALSPIPGMPTLIGSTYYLNELPKNRKNVEYENNAELFENGTITQNRRQDKEGVISVSASAQQYSKINIIRPRTQKVDISITGACKPSERTDENPNYPIDIGNPNILRPTWSYMSRTFVATQSTDAEYICTRPETNESFILSKNSPQIKFASEDSYQIEVSIAQDQHWLNRASGDREVVRISVIRESDTSHDLLPFEAHGEILLGSNFLEFKAKKLKSQKSSAITISCHKI